MLMREGAARYGSMMELRILARVRDILTEPKSGREREERKLTPFQPHRADAGAARTSPGASHNRVLVVV